MSAMDICPHCGHPKRWTWHLAHCILNGVTLSDDDLRILAQAAINTVDRENLLRKQADEIRQYRKRALSELSSDPPTTYSQRTLLVETIDDARIERQRFEARWFSNLRFAASHKWTEWTK